MLLGWRTHTTTRSVCGGTISWWTGKAQMDSDQLLAALREDIEWPAATVRLLYNDLAPLQWVGVPVMAERVE